MHPLLSRSQSIPTWPIAELAQSVEEEMYGNTAHMKHILLHNILRGLSPPANYTDRATATCQQS
jgi:hypothetical protein